MDPLEPKAISLCFFSKLVLRNNVRVVHNSTRALLCRSVLSELGLYRAVLPPVIRLNWLQVTEFLFVIWGKHPCSGLRACFCLGLLALLQNSALLCKSDAILQLGGEPRCCSPKLCWACVMGLLQNFCSVICYWEQPV